MIINRKDGFVDFKAPVYMTEEQRKKFVRFMEDLFPDQVHPTEIQEKGKVITRNVDTSKRWDVDSFYVLFSCDDFDEIVKKTKRSPMSISMMMGGFYTDVISWAKKKGYSEVTKELIAEYLKETGVRR